LSTGFKKYETVDDLPKSLPIFPLTAALLLPDGNLPLNIFEPRYLAMVDAALAGDRLIGMVQPSIPDQPETDKGLCHVGCAGQVIADWSSFETDLGPDQTDFEIDRELLLKTFKAYLDQNNMEADWDSIEKADTGILVNALSMMSPYGAAEKQALLEADNLKQRADTLVAITEMSLAKQDQEGGVTLQ